MTCSAIDIGCHVAAHLDPLLTWWGAVGAFIRAWWWVAYAAFFMVLGAHLGKTRTYAVITAGLVALALRYWPQPAPDPDYETGEPPPDRRKPPDLESWWDRVRRGD